MKKVIIGMIATLLSSLAFSQTYVPPSVDKNGVYHQGYYRSAPNQYRYDNYNAQNSIYGGVNPYTGKRGYQKDEFSNPPVYNQSYGKPRYGNRGKGR